jgi:cytochrome c-type biogenesis protein CcmH/NrfG
MAKKPGTRSQYVKRDTLYVVAFVALLVGFVGGIAFNIYKTGSGSRVPVQGREGQGLAAEQSGKISILEEETRRNPGNADAWVQLGDLYFDGDHYRKAIAAYQKALELKPDNADVWTDLGVMYRRTGEPTEAVEAFNKAIKINPSHEIARFNKGIVLLHDLHDRKGAIQAWEDLLKVNPLAKAPNGQPVLQLVEALKKEKN